MMRLRLTFILWILFIIIFSKKWKAEEKPCIIAFIGLFY